MRSLFPFLVCATFVAAQTLPLVNEPPVILTAFPPPLQISGFAVDTAGNFIIAGSTARTMEGATRIGPGGQDDLYVAKLNHSGQVLWTTILGGSGRDYAGVLQVDSDGSIYGIGGTQSTNFPFTTPPSGNASGNNLVYKLDSNGRVLYARSLGWATAVTSLVLGPTGAVYIGGGVFDGRLPATPSAYRTTPADPAATGYLTKLDASGAIEAATYVDFNIRFAPAIPIARRPNGDLLYLNGNGLYMIDATLSRQVLFQDTGYRQSFAGADRTGAFYLTANSEKNSELVVSKYGRGRDRAGLAKDVSLPGRPRECGCRRKSPVDGHGVWESRLSENAVLPLRLQPARQ